MKELTKVKTMASTKLAKTGVNMERIPDSWCRFITSYLVTFDGTKSAYNDTMYDAFLEAIKNGYSDVVKWMCLMYRIHAFRYLSFIKLAKLYHRSTIVEILQKCSENDQKYEK